MSCFSVFNWRTVRSIWNNMSTYSGPDLLVGRRMDARSSQNLSFQVPRKHCNVFGSGKIKNWRQYGHLIKCFYLLRCFCRHLVPFLGHFTDAECRLAVLQWQLLQPSSWGCSFMCSSVFRRCSVEQLCEVVSPLVLFH